MTSHTVSPERAGKGITMLRKLFWRIRYVWHASRPIIYQRMDVKTGWYCSGCTDYWSERLPKEAAETELSYATP